MVVPLKAPGFESRPPWERRSVCVGETVSEREGESRTQVSWVSTHALQRFFFYTGNGRHTRRPILIGDRRAVRAVRPYHTP